jgi:hypothetical protein
MGCPKNWVPGTFEKLEVPLCSELAGDSGNAIKKFFFGLEKLYRSRGFVGAWDAQKIGSRELLKNWKCHCVQNCLEIQEMR